MMRSYVMKKAILLCGLLVVSFYTNSFAEKIINNEKTAQENRNILKISTFVTAGDVVDFLNTKEKLANAVKILKPLGVTKVFLDVYRGGVVPDKKILMQARDYFKSKGFEVGAGITTVQGKGFLVPSPSHRYFLCYDEPKTKEDLKKIVEYAASMFDELIVDDFFATDCKCKECATRKGDREWSRYFRDVMTEVSRDQVVGAARAVNKRAIVTIKYPQWYDRFHTFGYDLSRQPGIFDLVWAGTETRDPDKERVQQYEAFVNYSWIKSIAGKKMRGAWFDQINTSPETYVEQAYQSVLAGAPEITLFGFRPGLFTNPAAMLFAEKLPYLFKVANKIKGLRPAGVFAYKPINSDAGSENYLFDYLGMFGIPVIPISVYPDEAESVIVSEHSAADPNIAEKIKGTLSAGGTVLVSTGFIDRMKKNDEILKLAGIAPGAKKLKGKFTNDFVVNGSYLNGDGFIEIGEKIEPTDAKVIAVGQLDGVDYPILTLRDNENGGNVVVFIGTTFNFPPTSSDLTVPIQVLYINLATQIAGILRNASLAPLGIDIKMPTRIGAYLYEYRYFALDNFNDFPADVTLKFDNVKIGCDLLRLTDIYDGGKTRPDNNGVLSFKLPPRSMHLFLMEYKNECTPKNSSVR